MITDFHCFKEVEQTLQQLTTDIVKEWERRLIQPPLQIAMQKALGSKYDWGYDLQQVLEYGDEAVVDQDHDKKLENQLKGIIDHLPEATAVKFDAQSMVLGYSSFLKIATQLERVTKESPTKIYEIWFTEKASGENASESYKNFAKFFQNCQIRTCSEAMAETVGSIMKNHTGKGRFLKPQNFNKEIFLQFNLGPPFLLCGLAERVFKLKEKRYIYNRKADGSLVTHFSSLADVENGSAVGTYRKQQEKKAHLPLDLWKTT
jgi:hypothetical protein